MENWLKEKGDVSFMNHVVQRLFQHYNLLENRHLFLLKKNLQPKLSFTDLTSETLCVQEL